MITTWITLSMPYLSKRIVNQLDHLDLAPNLGNFALLIIVLGILQMLIRAVSRLLFFWPGRQIEMGLKEHYFGYFMHLPKVFFESRAVGDLISRLSNDIGQLRAFYAFGMLQGCNLLFLSLFALTQMVHVSAILTGLTLLPLLLIIVMARGFAPFLHKFAKEQQATIGQLTNGVTEAFGNVHVIQSAGATVSFEKRIAVHTRDLYKANLRVALIRTGIFPLSSLFAGLSFLVVLFYGGAEVMHGDLTIGDLLAFNVYIGFLAFPLTAIGLIISFYHRAGAATERLLELETHQREAEDDGSQSSGLRPQIEVRNLTYRFTTDDSRGDVLTDISVSLLPGERLGIVGPLGGGKSTLLNLLIRLYEPPRGTVLIDGQDVCDINPVQLRQMVGLVMQSPFLFSASVQENLTFGWDGTLDAGLRDAIADQVQMRREIEGFPQGWDTEIGEKGLRLSGGQRKRLALARALLRNPPILLLDDTTSALDQRTEKRLLTELFKLQKTMIIVSHRSTSLKPCQTVLVMDEGKIKDKGTFAEVFARYPHYFIEG